MIRCRDCQELKAHDAFYSTIRKDRNNRKEINGCCKPCVYIRTKKWRAANPEKRLAWYIKDKAERRNMIQI